MAPHGVHRLAGTPPCPDAHNAVMPRELFRFETAASVADFSPIDDRVMGGRSASRLRHDPAGNAVFEGEVSLAEGGGFASVRSRPLPLGDAQAVNCRIEVLGDGKRYKLNLRTDDLFDGVTYQAPFEPVPGEWSVLLLPLVSFVPTWRGRPVEGVSALRPQSLRQLGLTIGDRQAGAFALKLRSIALE
jgi:NADH dehydrogenase [ubiquinone] 1 alpha subcomplex assembly factor 1